MTPQPSPIDRIFRLCVAQLRPVIGDVAGNLAKARAAQQKAADWEADWIIFPSHILGGYPLQDLAYNQAFINQCQQAAAQLLCETQKGGPVVVLSSQHGAPAPLSCKDEAVFGTENCGENNKLVPLTSALAQVKTARTDQTLPFLVNYDEDPYQRGWPEHRLRAAQEIVASHHQPLIHVNMLGGQDGLVFDGGSFALQADGQIAFQMPHFAENISVSEWEHTASGWWCRSGEQHDLYRGEAADYHACMVGLRDYVNNHGFDNVLLGLSGGVDSALVAALAVDALGAARVRTVMLPYRYTSAHSLTDAQECARLLGCLHQTIPIAAAVEGFLSALAPSFEGQTKDVTEENLQARARGTLLMALSNKFAALLLTTGNKSEGAVGYATLYGDMCGGFNPIKDLYKQHVYALCHWRNNNRPPDALGPEGLVIPQNILNKAPSAELREGQKDEDSLPPYPVLDTILELLIEQNQSVAQIITQTGYDEDVVKRVENLLLSAEYKRRQSAPGIKISARSFDHDWHMPLGSRFRDRLGVDGTLSVIKNDKTK